MQRECIQCIIGNMGMFVLHTPMNLHAVDLNLLVSLDVLLESRSVSQAASRAGLSQSAMSRVLGRLRDLLDDPILVRVGNEMQPTARARELRPKLRALLQETERLLVASPPAPSALTGEVTLLVNDHVGALVLPKLLKRVRKHAPQLRLSVQHPGSFPARRGGQGDADLWVDGAFESTSLESVPLFEESFLSVVRRDHPRRGLGRSIAKWVSVPHGIVSVRGWGPNPIDQALSESGHRRHVALTVHSFAVAATLAEQTDLLFTMPSRLARTLVGKGHRVFAPPFELSPLVTRLFWHPRAESEYAVEWVRRQLCR